MTTSTNNSLPTLPGRQRRSLNDTIGRLDEMIDGLSEAIPGTIRDTLQETVGAAVGTAERAGHVDDSIDQFGPSPGRHRLVERVERGLVESLTFHQRDRRGFRGRAVGHEPSSSRERDPNRAAPTRGADRQGSTIKARFILPKIGHSQ